MGQYQRNIFLKGKYLGITEYIAKENNSKKFAMLIYNKKLSVCPVLLIYPLKSLRKNIKNK